MKRASLLSIVAALAALHSAWAKDITVTLTDQEQGNMAVIGLAVDQCVAGVSMRNDMASCKNLYAFLISLADKTRAAQQAAAASSPAEPPGGKP